MSWGGVPGAPAVGVDGDREGTEPVPRAPVSHDFPAMTVRISEKCRREQSLGGAGCNCSPCSLSPGGTPQGSLPRPVGITANPGSGRAWDPCLSGGQGAGVLGGTQPSLPDPACSHSLETGGSALQNTRM